MMKSYIRTPTGGKFYPLTAEGNITIQDISHGLALTNRYSGSTKFPYSVAQHSIVGAKAMLRDRLSPHMAYAFLFHDAAEFLGFGDLPAPVKYSDEAPLLSRIFRWLHNRHEKRVDRHIKKLFNVPSTPEINAMVKRYDVMILNNEFRDVVVEPTYNSDDDLIPLPHFLDVTIEEVNWTKVRDDFIDTYNSLRLLMRKVDRGTKLNAR